MSELMCRGSFQNKFTAVEWIICLKLNSSWGSYEGEALWYLQKQRSITSGQEDNYCLDLDDNAILIEAAQNKS